MCVLQKREKNKLIHETDYSHVTQPPKVPDKALNTGIDKPKHKSLKQPNIRKEDKQLKRNCNRNTTYVLSRVKRLGCLYEPGHRIFYKIACALIEDLDQPEHLRSLIRVFAGYSMGRQRS